MKEKLLNLIKERGKLMITEIPNAMPECKGDLSMYLPTKKGFNENIILLHGVTSEFISLFNTLLIEEKVIEMKEESISEYLFCGSPIYNMKVINKRLMKTNTECWLPISLKLTS